MKEIKWSKVEKNFGGEKFKRRRRGLISYEKVLWKMVIYSSGLYYCNHLLSRLMNSQILVSHN